MSSLKSNARKIIYIIKCDLPLFSIFICLVGVKARNRKGSYTFPWRDLLTIKAWDRNSSWLVGKRKVINKTIEFSQEGSLHVCVQIPIMLFFSYEFKHSLFPTSSKYELILLFICYSLHDYTHNVRIALDKRTLYIIIIYVIPCFLFFFSV